MRVLARYAYHAARRGSVRSCRVRDRAACVDRVVPHGQEADAPDARPSASCPCWRHAPETAETPTSLAELVGECPGLTGRA